MEIVEVTWGRALKVWWTMSWRCLVFGMLAGAGCGLVMGIIGGILGMDPNARSVLTMLVTIPVSIFVGIWVIKGVLYKRYSDFSVVCIANNKGATAAE